MVLKIRCSIEFNCLKKKNSISFETAFKKNDHIHIKLRECTRTHTCMRFIYIFFFSHFIPGRAVGLPGRGRLQFVKEFEKKKKIIK